MRNGYVLHVGTTRFHVRDRYVRRLRDLTDPKSAYEETCFYPMHRHAESGGNCYGAAAAHEQSSAV
jgi:hypothetical protein